MKKFIQILVKMSPIFVQLWISSHGLPRRHLPHYIYEEFKDQNRFKTPKIDARGGRELNSSVIKAISNKIRKNYPENQVHILS